MAIIPNVMNSKPACNKRRTGDVEGPRFNDGNSGNFVGSAPLIMGEACDPGDWIALDNACHSVRLSLRQSALLFLQSGSCNDAGMHLSSALWH